MFTPRSLDTRPAPTSRRAVFGLAASAVIVTLSVVAIHPATGALWQDGGTPPPQPPAPANDSPKPGEKPADQAEKPAKPEEAEPKTLEEVMERINKLSKAGHKAFLGKQYPAATESVTKLVALSAKVKNMVPPDIAKDDGLKKQFLGLQDKLDKSLNAAHERLEKKQFKEADLEYKKSLNVCTQCHKQFRIEEDEEKPKKRD